MPGPAPTRHPPSVRPLRLAALASLAALAACADIATTSGPGVTATSGRPVTEIYRTVDGQSLVADVFTPRRTSERPLPAILSFHGGGWVSGAPDWVHVSARRFAELGLVSIAVQYRLSDKRTTPIEALADTCASLTWVRANASRLGVDPNRIAVYAVSAGGQLVSAAATLGCGNTGGSIGNGGPDAMLLWSPALDVTHSAWFQKLLQNRGRAIDYSPVEHVPPRLAPTSVVQGAADTVTRLDGATRFCEVARRGGNRCELHVYADVGHLLTRNLKDQEDNFDPDPAARADGIARHTAFLRSLWADVLR